MKASENLALEPSLPRSAYWDAAYYEREQEAIFWDQWFYAGRASDLSRPGDYRVLDVAGESVILIRGDDRHYAHLNFCRHRGSRLLCGTGTVRGSIRCPYHAWAYALDGQLLASPFVPEAAIPPESRRLHAVGAAEWQGFVFVHLSPARAAERAATLAAQLGSIPQRLTRYPLAELRTARSLRYDVAANWKVMLENYNECYHCAGVHPELCAVVPAFREHGGASLDWERGIPHRQGAYTFTASGTTKRRAFPGLSDDEQVRHKGELVYPNLWLSLACDHVAVFMLQPQSATHTRIVCHFLFEPYELAKSDFDPSDTTSFWDRVNRQDWVICEAVQQGISARVHDHGWYAPMEDTSLDIRRYVLERMRGVGI